MFSKGGKKDDKKHKASSNKSHDQKKKHEGEEDDLLKQVEELSNIEKDLKQSDQKIVDAEKKAEEMESAYKRALADLENFRRRTEEEKGAFIKFATANFLLEIFPCLDNFKKSLQFIPEDVKKENWVQGLIQSVGFFETTLQKKGVEEMRCVGQKVDHNFHDAVLQAPGEKDVIIEELEKGYVYQGKVVKHAKVKVGNGEKE